MKKNYKLGFSLIEISVVVLIIGVLIAAITTGTDLVKRSKLASARNLSSNSSIYGMKDLVLWFEPSLPTVFMQKVRVNLLKSGLIILRFLLSARLYKAVMKIQNSLYI